MATYTTVGGGTYSQSRKGCDYVLCDIQAKSRMRAGEKLLSMLFSGDWKELTDEGVVEVDSYAGVYKKKDLIKLKADIEKALIKHEKECVWFCLSAFDLTETQWYKKELIKTFPNTDGQPLDYTLLGVYDYFGKEGITFLLSTLNKYLEKSGV